MAKKKQEKLNDLTELESTSVSDVTTVVEEAPVTSDEVSSSVQHEPDVVAQAELHEQTESAAYDAAIDSDAVVKPVVEKEETLADRVRIVSPLKLVLKRFFRSRLSVIGLSIFIAVLVFSFLGPVFVPWGADEVDRDERSEMREEYSYIIDTEIVGLEDKSKDGIEAGENNDFDYYLVGYSKPIQCNRHAAAGSYGYNEKGERAMHVLGTDNSGYDIFVRIMYGGRLSLLLSFFVVLVYTVLGIILGGLAGYFGGWVDMIIMRLVDIINCIPSLPILLIVGAILAGNEVDPNLRIYFLMGALTLLSWAGTARLVRGQILFLREQEYMVAADALGFSSVRKIFKHLARSNI